MRNLPFKKLATVAAVSAALGAAGVAQANLLAVPGNAVLVPLAQYSTTDNTNTLVGITVPAQANGSNDRLMLANFQFNGTSTCNLAQTWGATTTEAIPTGIRWFFFDASSVHQADGTLPHTLNDFVPFDWRTEATRSAAIQAKTDGVNGYLIFSTLYYANEGTSSTGNFCFFADAMWIRGVWESAAYIPTYALWDAPDNSNNTVDDTTANDQITYNGGEPLRYNPAFTGMIFNNGDGDNADLIQWDMRYFLPQSGALTGSTDLVVWLPFNGHTSQPRTNIPIDVWDTGENGNSTNIDLPKELNVVDASTIGWTDWVAHTGPGVGGDPVTGAQREGESQGFITFDMPEIAHSSEYASGAWQIQGASASAPYSYRLNDSVSIGGVAFSLVGLQSSGNPNQIQTILGHQRGVFDN